MDHEDHRLYNTGTSCFRRPGHQATSPTQSDIGYPEELFQAMDRAHVQDHVSLWVHILAWSLLATDLHCDISH